MNTFLLIMVMCSVNGQCDSFVIDHDLSADDCDLVYTDSYLEARVDVIDSIANDYFNGYTTSIESFQCVIEDTE